MQSSAERFAQTSVRDPPIPITGAAANPGTEALPSIVSRDLHGRQQLAGFLASAITARKSQTVAGTENQTAAVSSGEIHATAVADLAKEDADAKIDAAQEASNGVVDLIYVYNVASIGVGLLATTTATGFALLREHGGITAVSAAQRDAINAGYTQTISNLADDLIGRNANEALDDPIAIAAANQSATVGVRDAWQNVSNLQARAAETFAGTGPGGYGMMVAGMTSGFFDGTLFTWSNVTSLGVQMPDFGGTFSVSPGIDLHLLVVHVQLQLDLHFGLSTTNGFTAGVGGGVGGGIGLGLGIGGGVTGTITNARAVSELEGRGGILGLDTPWGGAHYVEGYDWSPANPATGIRGFSRGDHVSRNWPYLWSNSWRRYLDG